MVTQQYINIHNTEIINGSFCSFLSLLNFLNNKEPESLMLQNTNLTYFTKSNLLYLWKDVFLNLF